MRLITMFLIGMLTVCTSVFGQTFNITPKFPNPGDQITISYNTKQTVLNDKEEIYGRVYLFVKDQWQVKDLILLEQSEGVWEASIILPEQTALITCVFEADGVVDNGGKLTYTWMLDREPLSRYAWALLRSPDFQYETPKIADSLAMIDREVTMMWINNEMQFHPESRLDVFYAGLKLRKIMEPNMPLDRIKKEVNFLLSKKLNKVQQYKLQNTLELLPKQEEKAYLDSVQSVLLKTYPSGVLARDKSILKMFREPDLEKKIKDFKVFENQFPNEQFKDIYTDVEAMYYDKTYKAVAYTHITKYNDFNFIFDNIQDASFYTVLDYAWHLVSIPHNRETMALDSLLMFSRKIFPELEKREHIIPKEFQGKLSPNQWKQNALELSSKEYLTYAKILEDTKNYEEAEKFVDKIKSIYEYKDSDYNDLYARQLIRRGEKDQAISFIEACVKENNTTPEMLEVLRSDFNSQKYSISFDEYISNLKSKGLAFEEHKTKVISEIINKPIEGFKLESMNGSLVKLSKQKGKIVVIDMWATWCAPCKKAMPGMQMVVNKYANDKNVQFYFLDTQEFDKNYKQKVREFIKEKQYSFNVLFDAKNPETGKLDNTYSKYAKAFHFSGIPQKMIIDAKGNLRWRSTGYMGSPSELADEISIVIEYLKNEK